jgi:hypothetical protein
VSTTKKVGGQDLLRVLADELAPGALAAPRRRRQAMAAQHSANGEVGTAMTQLQQLTLDAAIAPARILPAEAQDQLVELAGPCSIGLRRTASISRPLATDQLAMPAEEGLRADQQSGPGWARQNPAQGAEQKAIGGLPARAADLTFENPELVT